MGKKGNKFKTGFAAAAREELEKEEEQKRLREKHNISDENTLVVEKDNTFKFTVRMLGRFIRFIATVSLLVLATVGIISLLYPEVRAELMEVLFGIYEQARGMVGI